MSESGVVSASIIVPTAGRRTLLEACLRSLGKCRPLASEVIVVDQSASADIEIVVAAAGARYISSRGRGVGAGVNRGLLEAQNELVMVTHDDCTADREWVGCAARSLEHWPGTIITGRVRPFGDPRMVPSIKDDLAAEDFTGSLHVGALYPNNMACRRSMLLEFGGFDEDFVSPAEDNDLCYRWLRAGRSLRYEPTMIIWHHDWRTPDELVQLYRRYSRAQGELYGRHLRRGDARIARFLARDLYRGARGQVAALIRRQPRWSDPRPRVLCGLLPGLAKGLTCVTPGKSTSSPSRR